MEAGKRTVVILGGGVGGVVAANRLRRLLGRDHRIVVFERAREQVFAPSLLWLAIGDRTLGSIRAPLSKLLRAGVEAVYASVDEIDAGQRRIRANGVSYQADALIIALGAELAPQVVPGLEDGGHNLYTADGSIAIRDALRDFRKGRIAVITAEPLYKCPAAPYEAALLMEYDVRRRGVRGDISLHVYAAEPAPMGVAGPAVSAGVKALLGAKGIEYHPGTQVTSVDPQARRLLFADGSSAEYDLLAYVPPHRAPGAVVDAGLTNASGWIPVDRHTMETAFPGVYAIGDITTIPLSLGKPLPKAGVFAHGEAEVVARRIAHAWTGHGASPAFDGHGTCFVESGDGRAAIGSGDFYAEPTPRVKLRPPSRLWHVGKVLFERRWLRRFPI